MILGVFGRPLSSRQAFKETVNEMNPFYEETYQGKDLCVYKVYQYLVKQCLLENPEFKQVILGNDDGYLVDKTDEGVTKYLLIQDEDEKNRHYKELILRSKRGLIYGTYWLYEDNFGIVDQHIADFQIEDTSSTRKIEDYLEINR